MTDTHALPRLNKLEAYLQMDPDNTTLLADAFEAGLQAGDWARAEFHLRHAQALGADRHAWSFREAHWLLAQHRWAEAKVCLQALAGDGDTPESLRSVLAHDLAYLALRQGDPVCGLAHLAPWIERVSAATPIPPALQALWLRLLHRAGRLDAALAWAQARAVAGQLHPAAAGVASLVALDAEQGPLALSWAESALRHEPGQVEALVTRANLALLANDAGMSRRLLEQALRHNPNDGRSLSALGFTELLERHLEAACQCFERAVQHMPGHVGTWHGWGWSLMLQGDLPGARRAFDTALELDRNFGESHGGMAVVLALLGERGAAEQAIERALRLDRGNVSAQYAQVVLSGQAGDIESIRRLAARLLRGRAGALGESMFDSVARAAPAIARPEEQ